MARVTPPLPELNDEQKAYVSAHWEEDTLAVTRHIFNDQTLTRRNVEFKAVRQFLASQGKVIVRSEGFQRVGTMTPEQMEYVRNNFRQSSPLEMARVLFASITLLTDSDECKLVLAYCQQLDPDYRRDEEPAIGSYEPPKSIGALIPKCNRYAINPRGDGEPLFNSDKLSPTDMKCLRKLLEYMQVPLFKIEADKCGRKVERELYESTFIAFCWDKTDLMAEDVHREIALAAETVKHSQIDRMARKLDERVNSMIETPGEGSLKMPEVELLNSVREKANKSMTNIAALLKTLVAERSNRLKERRDSSASMYPLVQAWKNQDDRRRIIQMNERKQKAALKVEVERLSNMDALKSEIYGLSAEDILR